MHPCIHGALRLFRSLAGSLLTGAAVAFGLVSVVGGQAAVPEATVKAAFVVRFPEFVEWPAATAVPASPVVCLSPSHKLGSAVAAQAVPRPGHNSTVVVRELRRGDSASECHVVYVAPKDTALLDELSSAPVLTVGDTPGFCQRGGIINMLVLDGRVRFEINLTKARRTGLRIDSQLLRLATRVIGGHP